MSKLQVQGVHHITIVGSTRQSAIDFWQGTLGMPFVLEQPNLGKPDENHLYFDPGDGRLLTVFTNEERTDANFGQTDLPLGFATSKMLDRLKRDRVAGIDDMAVDTLGTGSDRVDGRTGE